MTDFGGGHSKPMESHIRPVQPLLKAKCTLTVEKGCARLWGFKLRFRQYEVAQNV